MFSADVDKNFSIFDLLAVLVLLFFILAILLTCRYTTNAFFTRQLVVKILALEEATHLFYDTYRYFPGDFPKATNYWSVSHFNDKCTYWDDARGEVHRFIKGINGNGDHRVYWGNTEGNVGLIPEGKHTDRFLEATGGVCHLAVSGFLDDHGIMPVVLRGDNKANFQKLSGLSFRGSNFLIGYHDKKGQYDIVLSGLHSWKTQADNKTKYIHHSLNNARITAEQMYMVDKKIDDGMPGNGSVRCGVKLQDEQQCKNNATDSACKMQVELCCNDYEVVNGVYQCKSNSKYVFSWYKYAKHSAGYLYYTSPLLQMHALPKQ